MEVPHGSFWYGKMEDVDGPFKVRLHRRREFLINDQFPEWVLMGDVGKCGEVQGIAEGTGRRFTREHYQDKKLPLPPPVTSFSVRLLERCEVINGEFRTQAVDAPWVVRFHGVDWIRTGCTSDSIFCGGKAEFSCGLFEVVVEEEACDTPLQVRA